MFIFFFKMPFHYGFLFLGGGFAASGLTFSGGMWDLVP